MAFDATTGGADANSYVAVAFADDYFTTRLNSAWWALLTTAEKQAYLVTGTLTLETWVTWRGTPAEDTQALHWPAEDALDCKGTEIDEDTIPIAVQRAVCEQASYSYSVDPSEVPTAVQKGILSASVGSLEVEFDSGNVPSRLGKTAIGLTNCYGTPKPGASSDNGIGQTPIARY